MPAAVTQQDRVHLRRALELAEGGRGRVSPNPLVGAVLVRDGEAIGEGFHAELGGQHAEVAALEDCLARGHEPSGATLYVTLEPCAHQGRQPPCTNAILAAGVTRVVIASEDPSEKASGRGPGILRDEGIEVELANGEEAAAARLLNQPFRKHSRTSRPLVILKSALSLDGRVATAGGDSRWISGEASRALAHRWRAECDAVCVGIGTALADDPLLTARRPADRAAPGAEAGNDVGQPTRVVFDSKARLPLDSRLVDSIPEAPLLVIAAPAAPAADATTTSGASPIEPTSRESNGRRAWESKTTRVGWRTSAPAVAGLAVSSGSSASAVPSPTQTASHSARQRCTSARLASPEIHRESPAAVATRPSRLRADFRRTSGRPVRVCFRNA